MPNVAALKVGATLVVAPKAQGCRKKEDGNHKDCPYGSRRIREEGSGDEDWPNVVSDKRAVTRIAPTAGGRRFQTCATVRGRVALDLSHNFRLGGVCATALATLCLSTRLYATSKRRATTRVAPTSRNLA